MSEPVANAEIEDVLSSIRRLVTDEGRGQRSGDAQAKKKPASKLVLTPALRVPASQLSGEKAEERTGEPLKHVADIEEAGSPENRTKARVDPFSNPPWSNPENTLHNAAGGLAANAEQPADGEHANKPSPHPEISPLATSPEPAKSERVARAASLSAKIQALESAIAQTQDQWEPDGSQGDDYAGVPTRSMKWRDANEQATSREAAMANEPVKEQVIATPPQAAGHEQLENDVADMFSDEGFIDEEALRDLVADIVRKELQGPLGERITRNVRKLVRREIQRALTTQQFD